MAPIPLPWINLIDVHCCIPQENRSGLLWGPIEVPSIPLSNSSYSCLAGRRALWSSDQSPCPPGWQQTVLQADKLGLASFIFLIDAQTQHIETELLILSQILAFSRCSVSQNILEPFISCVSHVLLRETTTWFHNTLFPLSFQGSRQKVHVPYA